MLTGCSSTLEKQGESQDIAPPKLLTDVTSRYNSSIANNRRQNLNGVYDVHTNVMQYPKIMQPTHARWEQVSSSPQKSQALQITADEVNESLSKGTAMQRYDQDQAHNTIFPEVPRVFTRNFMISDTYYNTPSTSVLGYPGPDEDVIDVGPGGLTHVSEDVVVALPEDCRKAFLEARAEEKQWKASWSSEKADGARAQLRITYNV